MEYQKKMTETNYDNGLSKISIMTDFEYIVFIALERILFKNINT